MSTLPSDRRESLAPARDKLPDLMRSADALRRRHRGNRVELCAIVNAKSGICSEDCAFCAQSAHHRTGADVFPLLREETILEAATRAKGAGATRFSIVTSGYGIKGRKEVRTIGRAIRRIREDLGLKTCASLGIVSKETLAELKDAGLVRYHHNLETSPGFFRKICTTHDYEDDLGVVEAARAAGLETCCGGIFGLGESWTDRIELASTLERLDPDGVPINFLDPIPGTKLEDAGLLAPIEAVRIISLLRSTLPDKDILVCGGREAVFGDLQPWIFPAGANGIMIGDYLTTPGGPPKEDLKMIRELGLEPSRNQG